MNVEKEIRNIAQFLCCNEEQLVIEMRKLLYDLNVKDHYEFVYNEPFEDRYL